VPAQGPWDIADDIPAGERIDCGSLLIPVREGFDVQINVAEELGAWVAVVHGESGMQLQAFAAPRSGGLWDEVRAEIAVNIADVGGSCAELAGPNGLELHAKVPGGDPATAGPELLPVRFIGVDGPRWFLRAVVSGPAAAEPELAAPFQEILADVVVVRGDHPLPPKEQLEIRLPEDVQRAVEAQLAEQESGWELQNPFERGPEITETR
jgi:hypothetical protein